ncbi:BON domain-containing protein [Pyrinomonas sp.]|uniref:BON domain-containing protein n=1 Tax=Pyrinomonas sp. TaxID=2080306 RepID=UPI00332AC14D
MKKALLFVAGAALTVGLVGCQTTETTNANANLNSNVAVMRNENRNATTTTTNANREMTREDIESEARRLGSRVGQGAQDAYIWGKVRAALLAANDLRDSTINVDVENEVVTLRGTVANADQRRRAEEVAKGIEGVKSVRNELKVSATGETNANMRNANMANRNAR